MKFLWIFLSIIIFVASCEPGEPARSVNPNCDFSNPSTRTDGGWPQITRQQCEALGHCFDDSIPGTIWCFRENTGKSENPECDFSNPKQRVDGGWPQIRKIECESLGYCFDDTIPDVVWCIRSTRKLSSKLCDFQNPQERADGGWPGITQWECVARGFCFDNSTPNTKWCFKDNTGRTQDSRCDFSNPNLRIDGGWPGIIKHECEFFSNCFDDTIPNVKFCFIPQSVL